MSQSQAMHCTVEDQSPVDQSSNCGRDADSYGAVSECGSTEASPGSSTLGRSSSGGTASAGEASPNGSSPGAGEARAAKGKLKADLPPAIAEEPNAPSRGSGAHDEGNCSPCVWNWKPQGCTRGQACGYCHLCPEGEIKNRKKAKLATIRGSSTGSLEWSEGKEAPQEPGEAQPEVPNAPQATPGSTLHGAGECRPCAWFYKPQGCQNGGECRHCHLCPEGEIKARKKNKTDTMRTDKDKVPASPPRKQHPQAESDSQPKVARRLAAEFDKVEIAIEAQSSLPPQLLADIIPPPPGLAAPAVARVLPSIGSAQHGTGECRPCAWFYKPQGCQNAAECRHCHLCPDGEIKARRRVKAGAVRGSPGSGSGSRGALDAEDEEEDDEDEEEEDDEEEVEGQPETLQEADGAAKVTLPLPSRRDRAAELPSSGAQLHGSGECRPCAWFHKPQGCENGAECRHCHLCPEGEIRERRKNKVAVLKKKGSSDQEFDMERSLFAVQKQQEALLVAQWQAQAVQEHWEALWEAQKVESEQQMAFAMSPMGLDLTAAAISAMAAAVATASVAAILSDASPVSNANSPAAFSPERKVPIKVSAEAFPEPSTPLAQLPSTGSALHAHGKCRPCAWFWKSQGCQNGQACAHCHLCPEGELKDRKRVKEAAMRMGALEPVRHQGSPGGRSPLHARSPRVVKIAPILGA